MGGVRQMASPTLMRKALRADPLALVAVKTTRCSPALRSEPVMMPVVASRLRPVGRPSAAKVMGFSPVARTV